MVRHLEGKLGVKEGETTQDGLFTLKTVECLASCGTAPAVQINEDYYENLSPEKVDQILEKIQREGMASLTRQEKSILLKASKKYRQR